MTDSPPPGWYPDPITRAGSRWWDGNAWTDHWQPDAIPPPPGAGGFGGGAGGVSDYGGGLGPIGPWLSGVFGWLGERIGHLFTLMVVLILPASLFQAIATWMAIRNLRFEGLDTNSPSFEGFDAGAAIVAGVSVLVYAFASIVYSAAVARQSAMVDRQAAESWSETLRFLGGRLGRLLGGTLIVPLILFAAFVAYIVVAVALAAVAGPLGVLFAVVAWVPIVWLGLRLTMVTTSAAVGPKGSRMVGGSWAMTRGHVAGILGRLLLLMLIGIAANMAASAVTSPFSMAFGGEELDPAALDTFSFGDLFNDNGGLFVLVQVISSMAGAVSSAIYGAGLYGLYRRLSGEVDATPVP